MYKIHVPAEFLHTFQVMSPKKKEASVSSPKKKPQAQLRPAGMQKRPRYNKAGVKRASGVKKKKDVGGLVKTTAAKEAAIAAAVAVAKSASVLAANNRIATCPDNSNDLPQPSHGRHERHESPPKIVEVDDRIPHSPPYNLRSKLDASRTPTYTRFSRMPRFRENRDSRAASRANRQITEQDVTEGLPVRNWRQLPVEVNCGPRPEQLLDSDDFHIPLPKEAHLLSASSLALLKLARRGPGADPSTTTGEGESSDTFTSKAVQEAAEKAKKLKSAQYLRSFSVRRWTQVADCPEFDFLAKRRPGLMIPIPKAPIADTETANSLSGPIMKRARVQRYDADGIPYVEDMIIQDGETVEGTILEAEPIRNMGPPGSIIDGVGVVNEDGIVVAGGIEVQALTQRRKQPPPKRKQKGGPGRKKKRVGFVAIGAPLAEASAEQARRINAGPGASNNDGRGRRIVEDVRDVDVIMVDSQPVIVSISQREALKTKERVAAMTAMAGDGVRFDQKKDSDAIAPELLLQSPQKSDTTAERKEVANQANKSDKRRKTPYIPGLELAQGPPPGNSPEADTSVSIGGTSDHSMQSLLDSVQSQANEAGLVGLPQTMEQEMVWEGVNRPDSPGVNLNQIEPAALDPDVQPRSARKVRFHPDLEYSPRVAQYEEQPEKGSTGPAHAPAALIASGKVNNVSNHSSGGPHASTDPRMNLAPLQTDLSQLNVGGARPTELKSVQPTGVQTGIPGATTLPNHNLLFGSNNQGTGIGDSDMPIDSPLTDLGESPEAEPSWGMPAV